MVAVVDVLSELQELLVRRTHARAALTIQTVVAATTSPSPDDHRRQLAEVDAAIAQILQTRA